MKWRSSKALSNIYNRDALNVIYTINLLSQISKLMIAEEHLKKKRERNEVVITYKEKEMK